MQLSNERKKALKSFISEFGLKFSNLELLNQAFCHTSYTKDLNEDKCKSYERLEFLGDAVLKLAISDILFTCFETKMEGELTERRAFVVSDKTLFEFAQKINLSRMVLTGKCEYREGKSYETILACSFEALLGAIYIEYKDKGYTKAKEFLIKNFENEILHSEFENPKARLQEYTQKLNHDLPKYVILQEKGPAHNKIFTAGIYYQGKLIEEGEAGTKKEAEIIAAKKALEKLKLTGNKNV